MKKLLTLLLTLCLVVASAFSLTACGEHEHTAKTEWSKNETHHWHACEVDGCTTQLDKAEHSYTQGVCICGAQDANYQPNSGALTKADYIEVYSKVLTEVDNYVSSAQSLRATVGDTDFIEVPVNQGVNAVRGNTAMLYFLINLCNTSTFEIVDGFQDIQVIDNVSSLTDQIFKIRINMGYDEDLGIIKSTVYVEDHTSSEISISSLDFAFIYDFDSETLSGFTVLGVMGHKGNLTANDVNYLKYTNGTVYRINTEAPVFAQFSTDVLAECTELGTNNFASTLPDYSSQYISAMQQAFA